MTENRAVADLVERHTNAVRPLVIEANLAWWEAAVTGSEAAFRRSETAQNAADHVLADRAFFAEVKRLRESGGAMSPLDRRLLDVIWLARLGKQVKEDLLRAINERSVAVERTFNTFRAEVGGRRLTENDIRKILRTSTDSAERRAAWEASKRVGALVEPILRELARLRNEAARAVGFENYYAMALAIDEHREDDLEALFGQLDVLTRDSFHRAKTEADAVLAKRYGIAPADLLPWHYEDPFFQEAPSVFGADLDAAYRGRDVAAISREFYEGMALGVDDILARSDLYEKDGKTPHAFCTHIDREGDIRVIANVVPSERWMETMLHELGHSVYEKFFDEDVPWTLRTPSHIFTTEAIAMLFGRLAKNPLWMTDSLGLPARDALAVAGPARRSQRLQQLVFSRWVQVMLHFERELYRDPSRDLNRLWWDLVERYQELRRPEGRDAPDFASKIHVVAAPVYYHNYMLGELFASQLLEALAAGPLGGVAPESARFAGQSAAGAFLRERVFASAATLRWDALCRHATGKPLAPDAFARQFVGDNG